MTSPSLHKCEEGSCHTEPHIPSLMFNIHEQHPAMHFKCFLHIYCLHITKDSNINSPKHINKT